MGDHVTAMPLIILCLFQVPQEDSTARTCRCAFTSTSCFSLRAPLPSTSAHIQLAARLPPLQCRADVDHQAVLDISQVGSDCGPLDSPHNLDNEHRVNTCPSKFETGRAFLARCVTALCSKLPLLCCHSGDAASSVEIPTSAVSTVVRPDPCKG